MISADRCLYYYSLAELPSFIRKQYDYERKIIAIVKDYT